MTGVQTCALPICGSVVHDIAQGPDSIIGPVRATLDRLDGLGGRCQGALDTGAYQGVVVDSKLLGRVESSIFSAISNISRENL